jgi:hypothetical protein
MRATPGKTQRAVALLRALAGLLLVALSAGQALPALHFALTTHVVCAEHGELAHVGDFAPRAHPAPSAGQVQISGGETSSHEHEHCDVLATFGPRAALSSTPTLERSASTALSALAPVRAEAAHSSLALLSYAPKLAPPA